MSIREFTSSETRQVSRHVDNEAPQQFRQELIDTIFHLAEESERQVTPDHCYRVIAQSCGVQASGNPYAGSRYAAGRDLGHAHWARVYDVICRFVPEFKRAYLFPQYKEYVNRLLASYSIVWELNDEGHLGRVLPAPVQALVTSAFRELETHRFEGALRHLNDALDAYDARPRRDRDSCANVFDALESIAKAAYSMENATFGGVLDEARRRSDLDESTIRLLRQVEVLRHNKFGHGTTTPFNLSAPEIDFVYLTCIGGILLFARSANPSQT
jgi:hypothetical protein